MSITLYTARLAAQPTGWMWQQANIQRILEGTPELRLVVVRFGPNHSYHNECVQNHANIDTAKVFWARDMGTKKTASCYYVFTNAKCGCLRPMCGHPEWNHTLSLTATYCRGPGAGPEYSLCETDTCVPPQRHPIKQRRLIVFDREKVRLFNAGFHQNDVPKTEKWG